MDGQFLMSAATRAACWNAQPVATISEWLQISPCTVEMFSTEMVLCGGVERYCLYAHPRTSNLVIAFIIRIIAPCWMGCNAKNGNF